MVYSNGAVRWNSLNEGEDIFMKPVSVFVPSLSSLMTA